MTDAFRSHYTRVAIILHWLMAILLIGMLLLGEDMMEVEKEVGEDHGASALSLPNLHVNIGLAILILTVVRIAWRIFNPPPPMPATMKAWEKTAAGIIYGLFYVLMIGLPLTGWFGLPGFLARHSEITGLNLFGVFDLPMAPTLPFKVLGLHKLGSKIGLALLALHVLAALKHQFVDDTKIFARMMPH